MFLCLQCITNYDYFSDNILSFWSRWIKICWKMTFKQFPFDYFQQRQIKELESKLALKDAEINELRQRIVRNGTMVGSDSNGNYICLCDLWVFWCNFHSSSHLLLFFFNSIIYFFTAHTLMMFMGLSWSSWNCNTCWPLLRYWTWQLWIL